MFKAGQKSSVASALLSLGSLTLGKLAAMSQGHKSIPGPGLIGRNRVILTATVSFV